jgi:hypothetical protein
MSTRRNPIPLQSKGVNMITTQDVQDVIDVQGILAESGVGTAQPELVVALINWKHSVDEAPTNTAPVASDKAVEETF